MELKKIVPILAIMAMMCMCVVSMQPATAAHQTVLKAYEYEPLNPPGKELGNEIYILKGYHLDIGSTLHVDGGSPQWFRHIHFYVYNASGDQIVNEERNTGFGGIVRCWIDSSKWDSGTYKISVVYLGNDRFGYPRANKDITLHIWSY